MTDIADDNPVSTSTPAPVRRGARGAQTIELAALIAAVVVVVTAAHWPVLSARAVSMNDGRYVMHNHLVQSPSVASAVQFLEEVRQPSTVLGYYQPLTMISLMLDTAMGGGPDNLRPYHRTSLVLHAVNTALIVLLLYLLLGEVWVAALAGLLFGLHPMTVEPVAWLGERKTLLATFFGLAALVGYVAYARRTSKIAYAGSLAAFLLALMSKPTLVPLPLLLVLFDVWPLRRLRYRTLLEKLPFFLLAAVGAYVTVISQRHIEIAAHRDLSAVDRVLLVCHNLVFYPYKMLWPAPLSSVYPFPDPIALSHPMVLAGAVGTLVLMVALAVSLRWTRGLMVCGLFFGCALAPTLANMDYSMGVAADKYAYFPAIGLLIALAWGLSRLWQVRSSGPSGRWRRVALVIVVVGLAALEIRATRNYLASWQNTRALALHILGVAPETGWCHNLLGQYMLEQGQLEDARLHLEKAVHLEPHSPTAHVNLGRTLVRGVELGASPTPRRDLDRAIEHYALAVKLKPDLPEAQLNLATRYRLRGNLRLAVHHYQEALRHKPDSPNARLGLALAQAGLNQVGAAIENLRLAIQLTPDDADLHFQLAEQLMSARRFREAVGEYEKALRLGYRPAVVHNSMGAWLYRRGQTGQAIARIRQAVQLAPAYPEAHYNLAVILSEQGETEEAIQHCRRAIELKDDYAEAYFRLGVLLAGTGRGEPALAHLRRAAELDPEVPVIRRELAAELVRQDRLDEAIDQLRVVIRLRPRDLDARTDLGDLLLRQGRVDQATAEYRRALQIDPNHVEAKRGLAAANGPNPATRPE